MMPAAMGSPPPVALSRAFLFCQGARSASTRANGNEAESFAGNFVAWGEQCLFFEVPIL
jgi:hypothetical protein